MQVNLRGCADAWQLCVSVILMCKLVLCFSRQAWWPHNCCKDHLEYTIYNLLLLSNLPVPPVTCLLLAESHVQVTAQKQT